MVSTLAVGPLLFLLGPLYGLVGSTIEAGLDQERLKPVGLRDPSEAITEELLNDLAKRFSLIVLEPNDVDNGQRPHLVLRLQTTKWGIQNAKLTGVGAVYESTLTLVDTRTNTVLVAAECTAQPVEGESVDELSKRGKAGLEDEIASVTTYCLDDYRHRVLGL